MSIPSDPLTERERQAVLLAHDVHDHLLHWLTRHGVACPLVVSPFVDATGQPSVLLRLNSPAARTLLRALTLPAPPSNPRNVQRRDSF
ncbi:hypothetical protein SAMN04489712_109143 [Thermomonospora echinospora]|uniref:Uncharacterized protein n=1 Tax=Thermomonospora echinospora TaxID=1992 RepID=A0A1H6CBF5_9ACTN|nr:hypothetical protein [Thermomonospora echinospora]SEG70117.1 hypothetical protein SAMN04489712_109143 [Thermomonospora echinospora]